MNRELFISKSIEIAAHPQQVWEALVNPEMIKRYLFGTETLTDWKEGSAIIFQGEYQGKHYQDKGKILTFKQGEALQYTYWSGFSGLEDKPENYSVVSYKLDFVHHKTTLTVTQEGFKNEQAQQHSLSAWAQVLQTIKELVEHS